VVFLLEVVVLLFFAGGAAVLEGVDFAVVSERFSSGACAEAGAAWDWPRAEDSAPPTSAHPTAAVGNHNFRLNGTTFIFRAQMNVPENLL